MVHPLIRRAVLTQKTRDKFFGLPFKWGSADCAKVAAWHVRQFGWKVPPVGRYDDMAGALARLEALGCETLPDLVDEVGLAPVVPASVLPGDLLELPAEHRIGAIGIVLGNGLMLGFHEDVPSMAVLRVLNATRAWSIWKGRP